MYNEEIKENMAVVSESPKEIENIQSKKEEKTKR